MELKEGYKNTEIGVIPKDWKVCDFGDIFGIIGGGAFKSTDSVKNGIKWLKIANIGINKIKWNEQSFLPEFLVKEFSSFELKKNDYVLALTRPILHGKLKISKLKKTDVPALLNQRVGKVYPNSNNDIHFIYFLLQSNKSINALLQSMAGTDPPNLGNKGVYAIPCGLPPLPEQTAIATVLSDTDNLLQALEKKIAKKRLIKKGAMQKLLKPKKGWVVKTLGDFLIYEQPTNYIVESTEYNANYDIPVLTAGKSFILGYTNETEGIFSKYPVIIFDDFTTATKFVTFPFKVKSSAMKILKPKNENINLRFIFEIMQQIDFPLGDHKRHWIGEFKHLEIKAPPTKQEQAAIATILSDMDTEIENLEKKLEKHKQVKQGLMQVLLTGKIRLNLDF